MAVATKRAPVATKRGRILIVEDEADQQELLRYNLFREGFEVLCVEDGRSAVKVSREEQPDLILLDLMLPGIDGLEVCKTLRSDPSTASIPILMLTAKSEDSDIVTGLELGADDYVTKPYSPRVLLARAKAVMRARVSGESKSDSPLPTQTIENRDLVIRPDRFEATLDGKRLELSSTEFRMLAMLAAKPGRVFTRTQIIRIVHGENCAVTDRSVDVHIFWLRQKLGSRGRMIESVRGVGYRFRESEN